MNAASKGERVLAGDTIYTEDLSPIVERLVKVNSWVREEAERVCLQYRNYLFLCRKYPDQTLPPSKEIDEVWHAHILHTRAYRRFCEAAFGEYLDHYPEIPTAQSQEKFSTLFERTQHLYHKEFGEYIYQVTDRSLLRKYLDRLHDVLVVRSPKFAEEVKKIDALSQRRI